MSKAAPGCGVNERQALIGNICADRIVDLLILFKLPAGDVNISRRPVVLVCDALFWLANVFDEQSSFRRRQGLSD